jgi:hypothetical protein
MIFEIVRLFWQMHVHLQANVRMCERLLALWAHARECMQVPANTRRHERPNVLRASSAVVCHVARVSFVLCTCVVLNVLCIGHVAHRAVFCMCCVGQAASKCAQSCEHAPARRTLSRWHCPRRSLCQPAVPSACIRCTSYGRIRSAW